MAARLTTYLVVGIVAATFIAGLIVGAQRDDSDGPVDLIVHNAVVYTGAASGAGKAEAVAVRANQVLKVGSNREILRMQRPQTVTIDAKGAAVLPGFNDAHLHLIEGGLILRGVDLSGAATVDEAIERVRAWAVANPREPWITGRGWTEFAGETPQTRRALDALDDKRPVFLASEDGKSAWVNSAALRLARIARRAADPDDGRIIKDSRGEPTGILEGAAAALVETLMRKPSREDRLRALFAAVAEAQRLGITSVQTAVDTPADLEMIDAARRGGDIDLRIYAALPVRTEPTDAEVAKLDPLLEKHPDDALFKSGVSSVDAGMDDDSLNRLVRLLDSRGWQVAIEVDDAEEAAKARTAFEHAARSNQKSVRERRHRLEHLERHFVEVGSAMAIGSDWPRGPLAPVRVLEAVLDKLKLRDAVRAYTSVGAYASYDEQRKGLLKPGMLADIVVLSEDIFDLEPTQLETVRVAYTIFDGRVVFPADRRTTNFP